MIIEQPEYRQDLQKVIDSLEWNSFARKSFLVIGASGMIGSFMIDVLMLANQQFSLNIEIFAMGRNQKKLEQRFASYLVEDSFHIQIGDITNPLPNELSVDYLIHGASNTHPQAYATDPVGTIMTNLIGTEVVFKTRSSLQSRESTFSFNCRNLWRESW